MKFTLSTAALLLPSTFAFLQPNIGKYVSQRATYKMDVSVNGLLKDDLEEALDRQIKYSPGKADSDLAKRFGHLAGKEVKTVSESFSKFTDILGSPVNALYKNYVTDLVGQTHLIVVDARFKVDPVWSVGFLSALDLVLKNYPEKELGERIVSALCECLDLDEQSIRNEAKSLEEWAVGKTKDDISAAMRGEGDSIIAKIANDAKGDQFWMYSKYFGLGLVKIMEIVGVEMDAETAYTVMEEWVGTSMGKPFFTACSDSDNYFRIKAKIDMMETLMREVEIREKKRLAQRLEDKAEAALAQAKKDKELAAIEAADEAKSE